MSDKRKSDEAATSSDFQFSYIRDCSFTDYLIILTMLYDAGQKSHVLDCDMPDILHIFLTLKISSSQFYVAK